MKQRFSKRTRLVSALLTLAMVFTFLPFSALAAGGVNANTTIELSSYYFPDDAFREYLKATFDKTGDRKLQPAERNAVKEINVSGKNIRDLYGIQFFPNLNKLDCSSNQLTSLDVTQNTALQELRCYENRLTSLDVSQNAALQGLYCSDNELTRLDVRQNTALVALSCYENRLTELDVRQNPALDYLSCYKNRLSSLDVSQNAALQELSCYENQLTELDVRQNAVLSRLNCDNNRLTSLDVTQNTALTGLTCDSNRLTELDVSQNTALLSLHCNSNQLSSLDVTQNTKLKFLHCDSNQLTELDVRQNPALYQLFCNSNQLTELDVSNNTRLEEMYCDNNRLSSLNLECEPISFSASGNEYSVQVYESTRVLAPSILPGNFDINRVRNLTGATKNADGTLTVNPGGGKVTYEYRCYGSTYETFTLNVTVVPEDSIAIDASNFPDPNFRAYVKEKLDKDNNNCLSESEREAVKEIHVNGKGITTLEGIQNFPYLKYLYCAQNQLTSLDVSKNTELQFLSCRENNLTSLNVSKNKKLEELHCYDNQLASLDVSGNPVLWYLDCDTNQLTSLDVSKNTNLTSLSCKQNRLTSLDVSQNPALENLHCHENKLTSLDVSRNPALEDLRCNENQLTSLDVGKNTNLTTLVCFDNKLTSLDVSQNTKLEKLWCYQNQLTELDVSQTAVTELKASGNQITIEVEETSRTFDLRTLPGKFDVSKATNWNGGTVSGKTLKVNEGVNQVTYTYDCGKGSSIDFTLNVKVVPDGTVTPPSGGDTPGGSTPGGDTPGGGGDGGGAVVIVAAAGAVAAGVVGYGVYNYVSGRKLQALLPEGVAAPENRAQTALLLWNTAGRPEPAEAPAFADVADPDTAKAAQWCVEQGLMKRRLNGKFAPGSSIPAYQVLNAYRKLAG